MFIAPVARERFLAPKERNVLLTKPSISLLRELQSSLRSWLYKHFVPPGLKTGQIKNRQLTHYENFRDTALGYCGRSHTQHPHAFFTALNIIRRINPLKGLTKNQ
jgi:hypothetical protein